jgi:hypothetical protein
MYSSFELLFGIDARACFDLVENQVLPPFSNICYYLILFLLKNDKYLVQKKYYLRLCPTLWYEHT